MTALVSSDVRVPTPRHYLMCPPRYFAVDYVINPWMDPTQPVDRELALAQWTRLRDAYSSFGHTVDEIEPQPGLPDMVFAANSGMPELAANTMSGRPGCGSISSTVCPKLE